MREDGTSRNLREQTFSEPLRQLCLQWCCHLPFEQVEKLLSQIGGSDLYSHNTLWRICQTEAHRQDQLETQRIEQSLDLSDPVFEAASDLYSPEVAESVVFTDAIGVKAQKPTREKQGQAKVAKVAKRHDTDVMILPRPDGGEHFVCEGVSGQWTLVEAACAWFKREWFALGFSPAPLVALTDGAKNIRADLKALFGEQVRVVLDWYHLKTRVYQNLSMVAHGKQERESWQNAVLPLLWRGKVEEALRFLSGLQARHQWALDDLLGYLAKHQEEIIDYQRRQEAGKPIGSGRMEKGVDQVIGRRQKGKGMSWTKSGTRALALLTCATLNARPAPVRA